MFKSPTSSPRSQQYKNAGRNMSALKNELRRQCIDKIRDHRFDRHSARRQLAMSVVRKTVLGEMEGASHEEQLIMYESLMQDIEAEFFNGLDVAEEERSLENYLSGLQDSSAFCPKCQRNPLTVDHTGFLCKSCDFGFQWRENVLSAQELEERLMQAVLTHGDTPCTETLMPVMTSNGQFLLGCDFCDYSQFIA